MPTSCVPLEIMESAAIYSRRIKKTEKELNEAGFELHIDDFGSGYSSLTSLNELSFNTLKIDKSLIDHVCEKKGKTLVEQVILLAKVLNMNVIAEGVETKEQLNELKDLKCDENECAQQCCEGQQMNAIVIFYPSLKILKLLF